jgi:LmbE family N-acetylglucosaminyl deacetylase
MKSHRRILLTISVLIVFSALVILFWQYKAKIDLVIPIDLDPLSITGHHRLLVLAPHCDDETLGSGGLIQAAQKEGMQVQVVIETNGDGYLFATMEDFRRLYPHHQDFIKMGNLRQQESLQAMRVLGLSPKAVTFLSYPDRGTPELWEDNWSVNNPYHSPYIGVNHSPYPITYDPGAVYAGEDLLKDLKSFLITYQPDLIVYPHPQDVHPDHWGLSAFTRLALAMVQLENPGYQPDSYAYLVHRPDYPSPEGLKPNNSLLPPEKLFVLDPHWLRFDLNQEDIKTKTEAIKQYRSQLPLLHTLLDSFIRTNELFSQPEGSILSNISVGTPDNPATWRDTQGQLILPVQIDPVNDTFSHILIPSADLVAMYAARDQNDLLLICAKTDDDAIQTLIYKLQVKAITVNGVIDYAASNRPQKYGWHTAILTRRFICTRISMTGLENPWLLFVGASSHESGLGILDQVAWQSIAVEPKPGDIQR